MCEIIGWRWRTRRHRRSRLVCRGTCRSTTAITIPVALRDFASTCITAVDKTAGELLAIVLRLVVTEETAVLFAGHPHTHRVISLADTRVETGDTGTHFSTLCVTLCQLLFELSHSLCSPLNLPRGKLYPEKER